MIEPRSSFVDANGIQLHYLEWDPAQEQKGNDEIPLVLLHGLGATADTWRLMAQHLCQHHPVIAFDQRGHGQSEQAESGYDLVTMSEDAVHGMAALGLGQVALVGHGWGARVALVLAARHPALFSHLILIDCPHIEPRHWPGMTRERFIRETAPKEMYTSRDVFVNTMRQEMSSFWSPDIEAIVLSSIRELSDGHLQERLRPENQRSIRESLWEDRALSYYIKIACPVLLIPAADQPQEGEEYPERLEHADEFAVAKGYMAAQVAHTISHCTVLWMPNTSHDIQLQRPQLLAKMIEDFMRNNI